jgi:anti-sigma factor RsiW
VERVVMIGHLGSRVSALLDGQMSPEEADRAWAHVHACHACRDLVEREGWVKTRLAGLSWGETSTPDHLKGSLLGSPGTVLAAPQFPTFPGRLRRNVGLVALGGGAVGAAFVGVLALGAAPADAPTIDRRTPTSLVPPSPAPQRLDGPPAQTAELRRNATR